MPLKEYSSTATIILSAPLCDILRTKFPGRANYTKQTGFGTSSRADWGSAIAGVVLFGKFAWVAKLRNTQGDGSTLPLPRIGVPDKIEGEIDMEYPRVIRSGGVVFWAPPPKEDN